MKITVLRNLGRGLPPYQEGEVVDADDDIADRLFKMRLAVPFEGGTPTKQSKNSDLPADEPETADPGDDELEKPASKKKSTRKR